MLQTIDILLGVTVVMLIVSMCVTMITQAWVRLRETRGKKLLEGLSDLIQQIDPTLDRALADGVAGALLRHPLVSEGQNKLGATIHREEFTNLLLELGSGNIPAELRANVTTDVQQAITKILLDHGVTDPQRILENVRSVALQLERTNPELATDRRHSMALMQEVREQLVGKVHAWFDQTIDRVASRFTADTRQVTVICSFAVAFALQLDVVGLMNRLSVDPELRRALVAQATATVAATPAANQLAGLQALTGQSREELQGLAQIGAVTLPGKDWVANWGIPDTQIPYGCAAGAPCPAKISLLGVLLSALMLSLGAPFWYNALKNLVRLRSVIATKDDDQRLTRQTTQSAPTTAPVGGAPRSPA
jgi:hypothetical protein